VTPNRSNLGALSRRRRRQLIVFAVLRTVASVSVLVAAYFALPFDRLTATTSVLLLTGGLLVVGGLLALQIRATMRSPHPGMRAVESLGISVPLILLLFSVVHYLLASARPDSYTEPLTRLDSLYFSVTMFATVGFGDISPVSELARLISMVQMLANLIFLGVVARVLFGAALDGRGSPTDQEVEG
jgi:voltage-gated potassium channel